MLLKIEDLKGPLIDEDQVPFVNRTGLEYNCLNILHLVKCLINSIRSQIEAKLHFC